MNAITSPNRRLAFWLIVALLLGNLAAGAAAPSADTIYVVRPGDTLSGIAARFGVSPAALAQANGIKNLNLIFVGESLTIPGAVAGGAGAGSTASIPASGSGPCPSVYVVQAGDTLGRIAARCATTVSAILSANTIPNINLIFVGQQLVIPGGAVAVAAPTAAPVGGPTPLPTASAPPAAVGPVTIANPSFEDGWTTDGRGNQTPNGWSRYSPPAGSALPFPTKMQQGATVAAISQGIGEYVHKLYWQLPDDERLGQPQGLILDGDTVYKAFDLYHSHALQLSQTLNGPPGHSVHVTVYILGETHDTPCKSCTKLEDDHFVASLRLGSAEDRRIYANMRNHFDVPGNQRAWNLFSVTTQFPPTGQLPLVITVQENWAGKTDFFIDDAHADLVN